MKRMNRICEYPGCNRLTSGNKYCEEHQLKRVDTRESAGARGYDYRWKRFRDNYLSLPQNQLCALRISKRCQYYANCIDHIIPLELGGDKYDPDNLQPSCIACNTAKGRRVIYGKYRVTDNDMILKEGDV